MKLFGKNSVIERLRFNPKSIRKIYIQEGMLGVGLIQQKAKAASVPVYFVPKSKISKIGRSIKHQGVITEVEGFEYEDLREMVEMAKQKKRCLVFLDNLNDPQNLGSIIRSLACLGKFSLVIPTHKSVSVTESVLRVASGGDNHIPIAQTNNINNAIKIAKDQGFFIAGTVVEGGQSVYDVDFPYPLGLVIGSEQKGIRDGIKKHLDLCVTVPMAANTLSLNVGHATTILAYEITRQRQKN